MSQDDVNTPEQEVNTAPESTVNDQQDTVVEDTIGALDEPQDGHKVPESVPIARLNKEIGRRKAVEKELEELRAEKDADTSVSDTDKDPDVKELAKKLKQIEDKEARLSYEAKITAGIEKALADNPEYTGVANTDVLKQLAANPANKDKTFSKLLEETYGHVISGKRTTETATPRGGAKEEKVDLKRAEKDVEYRRQILSDPGLKKQYNEGIEHRIGL